MNSLNHYDTLQFGNLGAEPLQACSSSVPAGSRHIPDVVSKDVNVVCVMELTEPHKYARNCA
jgi:hypothetical protein